MANSLSFKGTETRVNTYTTDNQGDPNIAANPFTGGYQIVWESFGQDGDGLGVYGRNYDANGTAIGGEIAISDVTVGDQENPDVAFNEDGNGSWVWQTNAIWTTFPSTDFTALPADGDVADNFRTRSKTFGFDDPDTTTYNDERVRYGRTFDEEDNNAFDIRVISLDGDRFVTSMQRTQPGNNDVVVDEYIVITDQRNLSPRETGNPFKIPDQLGLARDGNWSRAFTEDEKAPRGDTTSNDIAQLNEETLIVVNTMTTDYSTGANGIIQFQPFERRLGSHDNGLAFELGNRYELDGSGNSGPAAYPTIAILNDGGFAITWSEYNYIEDQDNPHFDIYAQVFNADYSARSSAVLAHSPSKGEQYKSEVAALNDGGFIITYLDNEIDAEGAGVTAQRFDSKGVRLGDGFQVNKTEAGNQRDSAVEVLNNGDVVVTWESENVDGSGTAVMSQTLTLVSYTNKLAQELTGTDANERFSVGAKDDIVHAGGGKDVVKGGGGEDELYGDGGNDKMLGGGGNDNLSGGEGNDKVFGGGGKDRVAGDAGNDKLKGQGGNDEFIYSAGKDKILDFRDNKDTVIFDRDVYTGNGTLNKNKLRKIADDDGKNLEFNFGDGNKLVINGVDDFKALANDLGFI